MVVRSKTSPFNVRRNFFGQINPLDRGQRFRGYAKRSTYLFNKPANISFFFLCFSSIYFFMISKVYPPPSHSKCPIHPNTLIHALTHSYDATLHPPSMLVVYPLFLLYCMLTPQSPALKPNQNSPFKRFKVSIHYITYNAMCCIIKATISGRFKSLKSGFIHAKIIFVLGMHNLSCFY